MFAKMRKPHTYSFKRYFVALPIAAIMALNALPANALIQDEGEESVQVAKRSNLFSLPLPEGVFRYHGAKKTAQFAEILQTFAAEKKVKIGEIEVLVWQGANPPQETLAEQLKNAEYDYAAQPAFEQEEFKVTAFTANSKSTKREILGVWFQKGEMALLTWARVTSASNKTTQQEHSAASKTPDSAKVPSSVEFGRGKTPANFLGDWSWTTISSVNYLNTQTNTLAAPSGMSARFTFTPGGRYKKFFYIRQRTYNLVTESTTTEEGSVTFTQGSFTLRPDKGYYKGSTGTQVVDRPMTPEERKPSTYVWEWRTENGKQALYLGPSASSLKLFKKL